MTFRVGTVVLNIRDADTNVALTGVKLYLDGKLITISNSVTTNISVRANQNHTLQTVKDGYNDVYYREILVESGEKL